MRAAWHVDEQRAKRPGEGDPARGDEVAGEIADDEEKRERPERVVRCAACGRGVCRAADRGEAGGRHAHTFMNPAGQVFHVRVFDDAEGALSRGPWSDSYSWFPPHAWCFAHCRGCGAQLGWRFSPRAEVDGFFGFIAEMLVDDDE